MLNVAVVASPPLRVSVLLAQRGALDPQGDGPGALFWAPPLKFKESFLHF